MKKSIYISIFFLSFVILFSGFYSKTQAQVFGINDVVDAQLVPEIPKAGEFGTGGRIFATPIIAEGSLWIGSNDGRLYELDPQSGRLVSFFQVTERIVNRIVYNEKTKRFFVPTSKNEMYCIERAIQK
jgi:outer membrane protein assembly factor BamB